MTPTRNLHGLAIFTVDLMALLRFKTISDFARISINNTVLPKADKYSVVTYRSPISTRFKRPVYNSVPS